MALEDHSLDCCPGCGEASGLQSQYYLSNSPRLKKSHRLKIARPSVALKTNHFPEEKPFDRLAQDRSRPVEDNWGNCLDTRAGGMNDALFDLVEAASRSKGYAWNRNEGNDQDARTSTSDVGKGRILNDELNPPDSKSFAKALTTMVDLWTTQNRQGRQWTTEMDHRLLVLKRGSTKRARHTIAEYTRVPRKACKKRYQALTRAERMIKSARRKQDTVLVVKPRDIAAELSEDFPDEAESHAWGCVDPTQNGNCWGSADACSNDVPPEDWWCGTQAIPEHTSINMSAQDDLEHSSSGADHVAWDTHNGKDHHPNCGCNMCCWGDGSVCDVKPDTCVDCGNGCCFCHLPAEYAAVGDNTDADLNSKPAASTPKTYNVTYWATVECGDQTVHIPVDSSNVTGPEKTILDGAVKKVWRWVQEKGLGDKVGLKDAFNLAKDIAGDSEEKDPDVEGSCSLNMSCHSSLAGVPLTSEGDAWGNGCSTPRARAESPRSTSRGDRWCDECCRYFKNCVCKAEPWGAYE